MASKRANKYVFRGAVGLTAIAHEHGNGMLPQTLRHRVCRMGLSIEEALGIEQLSACANQIYFIHFGNWR
ncbi:hypothetical protein VCSRO150_1169 [Vibrio cholerae]|nr:hypothetical protein VCSRO150_1169 [Vibrio cholerae]